MDGDSALTALSTDKSDTNPSSEASGGESSSGSIQETPCKDDLHEYVTFCPVEGGHQKKCNECDTFIGDVESHSYFDNNLEYCPACGFFSDSLTKFELSDDFNVTVKSSNNIIQKKIITNLYKNSDNQLYTLSSPSNAHNAYSDFNVAGAKIYYDDTIDDGTKLFVQKETSDRKSIGTCKKIYTYTLYVYNDVQPGHFSYINGHISIDGASIDDWLAIKTPINQISYNYLFEQHHAEENNIPVSNNDAVIHEVTCRDCGQFLYQEIVGE